ncbi:MAG: DUF1415 domain-containing protein [Pontibacterium sp.]
MNNKCSLSYLPENAEALTRLWVDTMVVGLNLCPFAAPVVKQATLHYALCEKESAEAVTQAFLAELDRIQSAEEDELATTLLITPNALQDFDQYLDMLGMLQTLLDRSGLGGIFQLASFHPNYQFDGVPEDDITNWTNRSPFPCFHLIREGMMSRVLRNYKHPDQIPERNIQLMQSLGREGLTERYPPYADYIP